MESRKPDLNALSDSPLFESQLPRRFACVHLKFVEWPEAPYRVLSAGLLLDCC